MYRRDMEVYTEAIDAGRTYQMVANVLRSGIRDGTYPPGSELPKQELLCRRFAVSRSTVRRAVKQLETDGLDTLGGRGRSPVVRGGGSSSYTSGEAGVVLAAALKDAFEAEHVTIDAYSLSGETLNHAIGREVIRIRQKKQNGEPIPVSVTVRALLADSEARLLVGEPVDDPADTRPRQRITALLRRQAPYLANCFESLTDSGPEPRVSVQIRTLAATPLFKVYLLNRGELLHGHYSFQQRSVPMRPGEPEVAFYDALGTESVLFRFTAAGDDPTSTAFVRQTQTWFDQLWQTVAKPATLDR
jgi:hypothetical protein